MYLVLSIVVSTIIGLFLIFLMGPYFGGAIAFGLILGCLLRGVYLLNEIHKKMGLQKDKAQKVYEEYLEKRE
ncbi:MULTISPECIES: hypothetical protein [Bacillaceae]|uniref:hypothetical protein n=1 Tax=Bacillaceae TaxID=186817 RepID=UPI00047BAA12|nr:MULTISPECIES: hypothetical protein [Bacillaceae]UOE95253.1 hypothetical protein MM271_06425 [Alkalihalobacillus sp. LMS39]